MCVFQRFELLKGSRLNNCCDVYNILSRPSNKNNLLDIFFFTYFLVYINAPALYDKTNKIKFVYTPCDYYT